ncbi:MAG: pyrroline-5-carboxylate reductase [Acidobacteriia bacterium]|nr:pyrroline-5-carboxylate reductase [Terriglobia bacterium]
MSAPSRIALLGAGNIGSALLGGILNSGITTPDRLIATVRSPENAAALSQRLGIRVLAGENLKAIEGAEVIILAVKPLLIPRLIEEIRWGLRDDRVLVSLAASFPMETIERLMGRRLPTFRAMPNIPVLVGEGATGLAYNSDVSAEHIALVESIFRAVGTVSYVAEDQLHAVTALSGSGPAYIYMVIEAMIAGGLKMGLSHDVATRLAEQTVLGAAKLVRETGLHPAVLKDQVITPAGVTIAAVHELERHGLRSTLISAIEIATAHSRHLTAQLQDRLNPKE